MNSENPFAVSESCSGARSQASLLSDSPDNFRVDGKLLTCGRVVKLPEICIYTGKTTDLIAVRRTTEFPSMKLVIVQRTCAITYFVSRSIESRRDRIRVISVLAAVIAVITLLAGMQMPLWASSAVIITALFVFCVATVAYRRVTPPLTLVRFSKPDVYWVKGLPLPFLQMLSQRQREQPLTMDPFCLNPDHE